MNGLKIAVAATAMALFSAGGASAYSMTCQMRENVYQPADKAKARSWQVQYRITDRGWKTPIWNGWFKRDAQIERTDSITSTTEVLGIPNKDIQRGVYGARTYTTADNTRQVTFFDNYRKVSERMTETGYPSRSFTGTCAKGKTPFYKSWFWATDGK